MSGNPLLQALARPKFGTGPALPRLEFVARELAQVPWPHNGHTLHVTGSQGKGSVTMLTAALFDALGISCGRFLSPHLFDVSERLWIAGRPVDAAALAQAARAFAAQEENYLANHPGSSFGAFEALTALAFNAFAAARIEAAVIEAGIGGRHDATRAAGGAVVALTGIDLEHTALLGTHREDILEDKADLCPPRGIVVAGTLSPSLRAHLDRYAATRGFRAEHCEASCTVTTRRHTLRGAVADLNVDDVHIDGVETRLFGTVQLQNAALALLAVKRWLERFDRWPGATAFAAAARTMLAGTALPLRFEIMGEDPLTIGDVAHTAAALHALTQTLKDVCGAERAVFLIGVSSDKSAERLLQALQGTAAAFVFTRARHRGRDPDDLARLTPHTPTLVDADCTRALALAQAEARRRRCPLVVTGSVFLAAEIKTIAAGHDPAALKF